ncbi:GNAT family N-acetyltransferase [Faecalibacter sp. LW9]|uniref:GNAT family N-acetyltransferase n=1 Tax=Faecalibacter sp. LW9 TaxID=3103144 RepID=UPI002AFF715D|nr:GNAT family N-acetyltransferase [Faecalibacter sp. LW9]
MITIREVKSSDDWKTFINLPFQIYKNNSFWVPPIKKNEIKSFNPSNDIFKTVDATFLLAYKDGKAVGRIVAIINWTEVNELHKSKVRFGWLDYENDLEILKALLDEVEKIGKQHRLEYMEGTMGFSNMDKAGMLTEGFDYRATMIGIYNHQYYPTHIQALGFKPEAEWLEYTFRFDSIDIDKARKLQAIIEKRYGVSNYQFKSINDLMPYVDEMFDLINKTYAELQSFVPIEKFQVEHYKKKYLKFIHPDFISCVKDAQGKMIAFAITMPSFSKGFQKANGSLFPFGWWHLMQATKKNNHAEFYLIGIDPEYQNKGINALIFTQLYESYKKRGVETIETNPLLEENTKIQHLWKNFDPKIHKRRKTFRKNI